LFPNWTRTQQKKSGILKALKDPQSRPNVGTTTPRPVQETCTVYTVDVWEDGTFHSETDFPDGSKEAANMRMDVDYDSSDPQRTAESRDKLWRALNEPVCILTSLIAWLTRVC
jgi:hypothetical protein